MSSQDDFDPDNGPPDFDDSWAADTSSNETEDIAYADAAPSTDGEPAAEESAPPDLPRQDEDATAVLRVCRNELNTINTCPLGGHWFSA